MPPALLPRWRVLWDSVGLTAVSGPIAIGRASRVGMHLSVLSAAVGAGQAAVMLFGCGPSGLDEPGELLMLGEIQYGPAAAGEGFYLLPVTCPCPYVIALVALTHFTLTGDNPETPPVARVHLIEDDRVFPQETAESRIYSGPLAGISLDVQAPLGATRGLVTVSLDEYDGASDFTATVVGGALSEHVLAGPITISDESPAHVLEWDIVGARFARVVIAGETSSPGRQMRVGVAFGSGRASSSTGGSGPSEPSSASVMREAILLPLVGHAAEGTAVISPGSGSASGRAVALGMAGRAVTAGSVRQVRFLVSAAVGGVTFAEVAVYRGDPQFGTSATLFRVATGDISSVVTSLGIKTATVTFDTAVETTDFLWAVVAHDSDGNLGLQGCGITDNLQTGGLHLRSVGLQPTVTPSASFVGEGSTNPPWIALNLAPILT